METIMNEISGIVPPAYQKLIFLAGLILPLSGRVYFALKNNGGLVGVWNAIMFGTNTPKPPKDAN